MIYTNNQGPKQWTKMISEYFEHRIGKHLFDHIISAFKVNGKVVEMCRTSQDKSVEDLVRCTKIPENTEICFIDDQLHPLMEKSNVYYINIKPYRFSMEYRKMAELYYNKLKSKINMDKEEFINTMDVYMKQYNFTVTQKSPDELAVDMIIGKKIMYHLEKFFKEHKHNKTHKTNSSKSKTHSRTTRRYKE